MIGSTWNVLLIAAAMGAGMFAQQAAHKVSATSEDNQVNSLVGLELFCSAEGYYLAGRFNAATAPIPAADPVSLPADEQPLLAADATPADDASSAPNVAPMSPALELAAAEIAQRDVPVDAPQASEADSAAGAAAEPQPENVAAATAEPPAAELPEAPEPQLAGPGIDVGETAEVLPPPAPDATPRADRGDFGSLAEDRAGDAAPRSSIRAPMPASLPAPSNSRYFDATAGYDSRYLTPADLVRERAIARGEQRRQRIETRKWLGVSPLRPTIDPTPYTMVQPQTQLLLVAPEGPATIVR